MMGRRGRFSLTPPRRVTFAVSLAIMIVTLASTRLHLPAGHAFVAAHRFWLMVLAYALLALGVVLPGF